MGAAPGGTGAAETSPPPSRSMANSVADGDDFDPVAYAQQFKDAGVPVIICRPNPAWTPDSGPDVPELFLPKGWNTITAAECDLSTFRPGVDVLAMVGGWGVDVVDVDTKAGGSVDNLPPFKSYGVHGTPSNGTHHFVPSAGIRKISPLTTSAGHVGDYVGGTAAGAR